MNVLHSLIPAVLLSAAAFGQTAPPRLEFEVASIKPSPPPSAGQVLAGIKIDGAQLHSRSLALRDYIQSAYKVKNYQVEGPAWLGSERYEIDAKLPAGATREQVPEMLQALFADRFELKVHRETKDFPVYGLVVGKGALLALGGDDVVHRGEGAAGIGHFQALFPEHVKGLGRSDLVDEVQADEELGLASGELRHRVAVPNLVVECSACHWGLLRSSTPII